MLLAAPAILLSAYGWGYERRAQRQLARDAEEMVEGIINSASDAADKNMEEILKAMQLADELVMDERRRVQEMATEFYDIVGEYSGELLNTLKSVAHSAADAIGDPYLNSVGAAVSYLEGKRNASAIKNRLAEVIKTQNDLAELYEEQILREKIAAKKSAAARLRQHVAAVREIVNSATDAGADILEFQRHLRESGGRLLEAKRGAAIKIDRVQNELGMVLTEGALEYRADMRNEILADSSAFMEWALSASEAMGLGVEVISRRNTDKFTIQWEEGKSGRIDGYDDVPEWSEIVLLKENLDDLKNESASLELQIQSRKVENEQLDIGVHGLQVSWRKTLLESVRKCGIGAEWGLLYLGIGPSRDVGIEIRASREAEVLRKAFAKYSETPHGDIWDSLARWYT